MKSTGIVRKVDDLGRIVIPKELRITLGVKPKDSLEIFIDGKSIIFKKYTPGCIICNNTSNLKIVKGKKICLECIEEAIL